MKKECCIPEDVRAMVSRFAHSRKKDHFTKQLSKMLEVLIKDKKLSFLTIQEKIGHMSKSTFLRYINTFRKIGLCRRKRNQQTNEICYYFVQGEDLGITLFFLKSGFQCPVLFLKKHGTPIAEQNSFYLNSIKDVNKKDNVSIFDDIGYLYLFGMRDIVKIGISKNLEKRIRILNSLLIDDTKLIFSIKIKNYSKIEKILHNKYKEKRIKGEWFRLTEDNINEIKQYLNSIDNSVDNLVK